MNWKFWEKRVKSNHDERAEQLRSNQKLLLEQVRRLRRLEIEAGIYNPQPIRRKPN